MAELVITPRTSGRLVQRIEDADGAPVVGVVASGDVYLPNGKRTATNVPLYELGSGDYALDIDPDWSTDSNGRGVIGEFEYVFIGTKGIFQISDKACWRVAWSC